jgi:hypothetical protein
MMHLMHTSQRTPWADRPAPLSSLGAACGRRTRRGERRQERGGGSLSVAQQVPAPAKRRAAAVDVATTAQCRAVAVDPVLSAAAAAGGQRARVH